MNILHLFNFLSTSEPPLYSLPLVNYLIEPKYPELVKTSIMIMIDIFNNKFDIAMNFLKNKSNINELQMKQVKKLYIDQLPMIYKFFGSQVDIYLFKEAEFDNFLIRYDYLIRRQKYPISYSFTFYGIDGDWKIIDFNFSVNPRSIF